MRGTEQISVAPCEPDLEPIPAPGLFVLLLLLLLLRKVVLSSFFLFRGRGGAGMNVFKGFDSFGQTGPRPT